MSTFTYRLSGRPQPLTVDAERAVSIGTDGIVVSNHGATGSGISGEWPGTRAEPFPTGGHVTVFGDSPGSPFSHSSEYGAPYRLRFSGAR